jgi:hypothetical protein
MPNTIAISVHGIGREAIATATLGAIAVVPRNDLEQSKECQIEPKHHQPGMPKHQMMPIPGK